MPTLADVIKREWTNVPEEYFITRTLGELHVGDKFIAMPSPGDNAGHGGLLGPFFVFMKTHDFVKESEGPHPIQYHKDYPHCRTVRLADGHVLDNDQSMPVLQLR